MRQRSRVEESSRRARMGIRYVPVFPDPLGATPMRSLPCRMVGMALLWMAVGSLRPAARMPLRMVWGNPSDANVTNPP